MMPTEGAQPTCSILTATGETSNTDDQMTTHSAHTSPTNSAKLRPRARSAETDNKKLV